MFGRTVPVGAWVVQLDLEATTCTVDRLAGFILQFLPLDMIELLLTVQEITCAVLERTWHRYRYFVSGL
ncbi:hypothetical protein [Bacillus toyonensis]|uniref:hypothetical protein n=1 Tax=Bacillus toyonensis TaxID=155322 RepID=UPI001155C509|nr:hypothetical protein [Bacillus toyonensis]